MDYDGKLISEFKCPDRSSHLVKFSDSTLLFASEGQYQVITSDLNGKEFNHFISFDPSFQMGLINPIFETSFGVIFTRYMDDTLYLVKDDTVKPKYLIDFQDKALTREKYLEFPLIKGRERSVSNNYMYHVRIMGVTDEQLSIYFTHNQKTFFSFVNLATQQARVFELLQVSEDSNLGKGYRNRSSYSSNYFIGYFNPGSLDLDNIPPILESLKPINPEDNPILVFYRFDFSRNQN